MDSSPRLLSLQGLLGLSQAQGISIGSAIDAIAAERFIARVASVGNAATTMSLTGYHLLPVASQRPEFLPAVLLRFLTSAADVAAVTQILESVCRAELKDQCNYQTVRLNAWSGPPDFALRVFVAEVSASVAGTSVHLPLELHVRTGPPQLAESQNYPSVLSDKHRFRVPCQSIAGYTADLMSKVVSTAGLDTDAGLHFQLAYLVRHYWSKIDVVADKEFDALRGELGRRANAPLVETLKGQQQFWSATAADPVLAQRWAEFIRLRGFDHAIQPILPKQAAVSAEKRVEKSAPPLVALPVVAEEILQFLYRVG